MTKSLCRLSTIAVLAFIATLVAVGFSQQSRVMAKKPLFVPDKEATCGEFGTTIEFSDSPVEAAKQALKEEKLVFVLHVSGNFETPAFT